MMKFESLTTNVGSYNGSGTSGDFARLRCQCICAKGERYWILAMILEAALIVVYFKRNTTPIKKVLDWLCCVKGKERTHAASLRIQPEPQTSIAS